MQLRARFILLACVVFGSVPAAAQVTVVDSAEIRAANASSPLAVLAGKVAGLRVVTPSGQPGLAPQIVMRAGNPLGDSDPLIVVDGVQMQLSPRDLNVDDITRIEIIRGAALGSAYGGYGANGVVRIFTKKAADLPERATCLCRTHSIRRELNDRGRQRPPGITASWSTARDELRCSTRWAIASSTQWNCRQSVPGLSRSDRPFAARWSGAGAAGQRRTAFRQDPRSMCR